MSLIFIPDSHKYQSLDDPDFKWISVTNVVSNFKQPFDPVEKSIKSSKNKKSKWYGISPDKIQELWKNEGKRSIDLGTWYHNKREQELYIDSHALPFSGVGTGLKVFGPILSGDIKIAPEQKLESGIYPEHFIYLKSIGICGQSDRVEVVDNKVNIIDYKTNKEISYKGYSSWDGRVQKMKAPISHLDDCHFNHYSLQLSLYMYMILKHNPMLEPGEIIIQHVEFENEKMDEYGYPIAKLDEDGNPIVSRINNIRAPYLKDEVLNVVSWLKLNKDKIKYKNG